MGKAGECCVCCCNCMAGFLRRCESVSVGKLTPIDVRSAVAVAACATMLGTSVKPGLSLDSPEPGSVPKALMTEHIPGYLLSSCFRASSLAVRKLLMHASSFSLYVAKMVRWWICFLSSTIFDSSVLMPRLFSGKLMGGTEAMLDVLHNGDCCCC